MSAVAWAPASSQEEDEWRLILAIPGAVETSHTDIFGHRVYNIHFPSGVHFQRDDYQRRIVGIDESKSGPVLCARMFMIASISALQLCPVNNRDALMAELDSALDRVDEFIAANGWKPTSKEQERKKRMEEIKSTMSPWVSATPEQTEIMCRDPQSIALLINQANQLTVENVRAWTDGLLSVPRPPVSNWCL